MSPETARTYIETIINYFCPRAAVAMELPEVAQYFAAIDSEPPLNIRISPNPVHSEIDIHSPSGHPVDRVEFYDVSGRLTRSIDDLHSEYVRISRDGMESGVYVLLVYSGEAISRKRMVLR